VRTVVVGGGISGLTAAYELGRAGIDCTLLEAQERTGGVLKTDRIENCVVECGADSFLASKPWAMELIRELGLESEVIDANEARRRTLLAHHGRLTPLPEGLRMMVPTRLLPVWRSALFSFPTKLRMSLEVLRRPVTQPDRSVASFVRDHFGQQAVDLLAAPLLAGVYGGTPDLLGAESVLPKFVDLERRYGSIIRGVRRESTVSEGPLFRSLRGGMGQLTEALASRVHVVHATVEAVEGTRVRAAGDWFEADQVILACGAPAAAALLTGTEAGAMLGRIRHSSATIVAMGFPRASVRHPMDAFGFLVPPAERRHLMACTWVTSKFPNRAPEGIALLRGFLEGSSTESDAELLQMCLDDLQRLMGLEAQPLFHRIYRWPNSLAQYGVGHGQQVAAIRKSLAGVKVIGNAFDGVGIPDCIKLARQTAAEIRAREIPSGAGIQPAAGPPRDRPSPSGT